LAPVADNSIHPVSLLPPAPQAPGIEFLDSIFSSNSEDEYADQGSKIIKATNKIAILFCEPDTL
jgi:hypothetical protein